MKEEDMPTYPVTKDSTDPVDIDLYDILKELLEENGIEEYNGEPL